MEQSEKATGFLIYIFYISTRPKLATQRTMWYPAKLTDYLVSFPKRDSILRTIESEVF